MPAECLALQRVSGDVKDEIGWIPSFRALLVDVAQPKSNLRYLNKAKGVSKRDGGEGRCQGPNCMHSGSSD